MHPTSSCPCTPCIRKRRYASFAGLPSRKTTIDATLCVSEIFEISKHSIRAGTTANPKASRNVSRSFSGTTVLGSDRKNFRVGRVVFFRSSTKFRKEAAFSKSFRPAALTIASSSDSRISSVFPSINSQANFTLSPYASCVILPTHGALQLRITSSMQCR